MTERVVANTDMARCRRTHAGTVLDRNVSRNELCVVEARSSQVRSIVGVRRVLPVAVAAAAVLLTAGCTVPQVGDMGIGVDDKGNPVGYLQVCHDHIDGATIYIDDAHTFGSWSATPAVSGFSTWSPTDPSGVWKVDDPLHQLKPRTRYTMYGWTTDNSSSAASVDFTVGELAAMKPGQVRTDAGVTTEDEFRHNACKRFG